MLKNRSQRHFFFKGIVPLLAVVLTLVLIEGGHRLIRFFELSRGQLGYVLIPHDFYRFDAKSGYRYAPNADFVAQWITNGTVFMRSSYVHTNAEGHVSPQTDSIEKPKNEIRIAVLGDSLTACIHSDVRWPDLLERDLNQDRALRAKFGNKHFKVINFARDGIGVAQFPSIVENEIVPYQPDLILVNFITADIYRRFVWRKTITLPELPQGTELVLNCTSLPAELSNPQCSFAGALSLPQQALPRPELLSSLNHIIARRVQAKLPWFSLYPDFLASLLGENFLRVLGRNPFHPLNPTIENRSLSISMSAGAIRQIKERHPNTLFLLLPTYWELYYLAIPKLAMEVMQATPEAHILPMIEYMPQPFDKPHLNAWTNYPYDMHFSNLGAKIYAKAVHKMLQERIRSPEPRPRLVHEDHPRTQVD